MGAGRDGGRGTINADMLLKARYICTLIHDYLDFITVCTLVFPRILETLQCLLHFNYRAFSHSLLPIHLIFHSQYKQVKLLVNNESVARVPEIYIS